MFIPDPDLDFLPIPDPEVKKSQNPGFQIRIRNTAMYVWCTLVSVKHMYKYSDTVKVHKRQVFITDSEPAKWFRQARLKFSSYFIILFLFISLSLRYDPDPCLLYLYEHVVLTEMLSNSKYFK